MQFQGGADVPPTSYSYSRCPYSDGDKCLGAAENWQSQDRSQFDWVQTAQFGIDAGSQPTSITLKDSKGAGEGAKSRIGARPSWSWNSGTRRYLPPTDIV